MGVVLEFLLAREDLTRVRLSRLKAVVDFNRAQQDLKHAVGEISKQGKYTSNVTHALRAEFGLSRR